ncbi:MAG: hypothetical protein KUA37_11620 [Desulfomicrobium sp.]|uniref:hypothetical protein n=1 Tax=Hoeflea sp. TaxID=1940281 RepID=UPI0025C1A29C|nr:hypothetical protein [Hoeflea sp.]MBU4529384.1 hypothetical protein [Alphaproteobacteria bacterium]MBV1712634.1 hypothetical protein [Desulfomicrobium sp.]MBU4544795.1 hypothetical protein [Alphaproteobacteria bacterium]MBU4548817.1 hypothetical protein [Alphaproteobacteria bacterium]MBV1785040.1 hypothetical protein [Hoeflea sp.]
MFFDQFVHGKPDGVERRQIGFDDLAGSSLFLKFETDHLVFCFERLNQGSAHLSSGAGYDNKRFVAGTLPVYCFGSVRTLLLVFSFRLSCHGVPTHSALSDRADASWRGWLGH